MKSYVSDIEEFKCLLSKIDFDKYLKNTKNEIYEDIRENLLLNMGDFTSYIIENTLIGLDDFTITLNTITILNFKDIGN